MKKIYIIKINFSCKLYMPIRRTRIIGGEIFIEKHHRQHENMLRIMKKIQEDQKLVNLCVMMLKADRNKLKRIKEEKK